jgi:lipoprotein signal peptidase
MTLSIIRIFCGVSHLIYGILTLVHPFYMAEFSRYGFSGMRILIGLVQIICGVGLLYWMGKFKMSLISAAILAVMMAGALGTRINIQDSLIQSLPALFYLLLNSYIFIKSLKL